MANGANRNLRGWTSAIVIAIALSVLVWFADQHSSQSSGHLTDWQPRTYTIGGDSRTLKLPKIASELEAAIVETDPVRVDNSWLRYHQRSATSLQSSFEPDVAVQLLAPRVEQTQNEWLAAAQANRISQALQLANDGTNYQMASSRQRMLLSPKKFVSSDYSNTKNARNNPVQTNWPVPTALLDGLAKLCELAEGRSRDDAQAAQSLLSLIATTRSSLSQLQATSLDAPQSQLALYSLDLLADSFLSLEPIADAETAEMTLRVGYAIKRRSQLWLGVHDCLRQNEAAGIVSAQNFSFAELQSAIDAVRTASIATGDVSGWNAYLTLDQLAAIAQRRSIIETDINAIRLVLDRVVWRGVTDAQKRFLEQKAVHQLAEQVQPLAISPIDYRQLLHDFEVIETEPLHRCTSTVTAALQSLRYSSDPKKTAVSNAICKYYRNANFRIAVSDELLNRFVPRSETISRPIHQNILGANTTGGSKIDSQLKVEMIPDASAWHVRLNLNADIANRTASEKGPAIIHSTSVAKVTSGRELIIKQDQLQIRTSDAVVHTQDRVRDIETDFDNVPLINEFVRYFVNRELHEKTPIARRITQKLVAEQTDQEFDMQLNKQLQSAQDLLQDRWVAPLQLLGMDSEVVDLQTTSTRLISRCRIAAYDSLAAYTPRPQAPSDALLSAQIHQSAFNNSCNQFRLGQHDWRIAELLSELGRQMHIDLHVEQTDIPEDVSVRFESENPITLEFSDDAVWLTLRFANLNQAGRIDLNHFIIRVCYKLQADGMQMTFVRTGAVSVDGDRLSMRDRLPLRAIFGRIFAGQSEIRLLNKNQLDDPRIAGLAVSQIAAREGWLAIAISHQASPHVALLKASELNR